MIPSLTLCFFLLLQVAGHLQSNIRNVDFSYQSTVSIIPNRHILVPHPTIAPTWMTMQWIPTDKYACAALFQGNQDDEDNLIGCMGQPTACHALNYGRCRSAYADVTQLEWMYTGVDDLTVIVRGGNGDINIRPSNGKMCDLTDPMLPLSKESKYNVAVEGDNVVITSSVNVPISVYIGNVFYAIMSITHEIPTDRFHDGDMVLMWFYAEERCHVIHTFDSSELMYRNKLVSISVPVFFFYGTETVTAVVGYPQYYPGLAEAVILFELFSHPSGVYLSGGYSYSANEPLLLPLTYNCPIIYKLVVVIMTSTGIVIGKEDTYLTGEFNDENCQYVAKPSLLSLSSSSSSIQSLFVAPKNAIQHCPVITVLFDETQLPMGPVDMGKTVSFGAKISTFSYPPGHEIIYTAAIDEEGAIGGHRYLMDVKRVGKDGLFPSPRNFTFKALFGSSYTLSVWAYQNHSKVDHVCESVPLTVKAREAVYVHVAFPAAWDASSNTLSFNVTSNLRQFFMAPEFVHRSTDSIVYSPGGGGGFAPAMGRVLNRFKSGVYVHEFTSQLSSPPKGTDMDVRFVVSANGMSFINKDFNAYFSTGIIHAKRISNHEYTPYVTTSTTVALKRSVDLPKEDEKKLVPLEILTFTNPDGKHGSFVVKVPTKSSVFIYDSDITYHSPSYIIHSSIESDIVRFDGLRAGAYLIVYSDETNSWNNSMFFLLKDASQVEANEPPQEYVHMCPAHSITEKEVFKVSIDVASMMDRYDAVDSSIARIFYMQSMDTANGQTPKGVVVKNVITAGYMAMDYELGVDVDHVNVHTESLSYGTSRVGLYAVEIAIKGEEMRKRRRQYEAILPIKTFSILHPEYTVEEDVTFKTMYLPTCEQDHDGAIELSFGRMSHLFDRIKSSVRTCETFDHPQTLCPIIGSYQSDNKIIFTGLPLVSKLEVDIIVNNMGKFTKTFRHSPSQLDYPSSPIISIDPQCDGKHVLSVSSDNVSLPMRMVKQWLFQTIPMHVHQVDEYSVSVEQDKLSSAVAYSKGTGEASVTIKALITYGSTGKCTKSTTKKILRDQIAIPPLIDDLHVLPIFCPLQNDAQVTARFSSHLQNTFPRLTMDGKDIPAESISRQKRMIILTDVGPGPHYLQLDVNITANRQCKDRVEFNIMPKYAFAVEDRITRQPECDSGSCVTVDLRDPESDYFHETMFETQPLEITKFSEDMIEARDREYMTLDTNKLVASFSKLPYGYTLELDVPYPSGYVRRAKKFCPTPLVLGGGMYAPAIKLRDHVVYTYEARPREQVVEHGKMPVDVTMVRIDPYNKEEVVCRVITMFDLSVLNHSSVPAVEDGVEKMTNLYWEHCPPEEGIKPLVLLILVVFKMPMDNETKYGLDGRRRHMYSVPHLDNVPYSEEVRILVSKASSPPPEPYQHLMATYSYKVHSTKTVVMVVYVHNMDFNPSAQILITPAPVTCDIVPTNLPYWTHMCRFTASPSTRYAIDVPPVSKKRTVPWLISQQTVVEIVGVLPLMVVCRTQHPPSTAFSSDGVLIVMISGGVPPYLYFWTDEMTVVQAGNTISRTGISQGVYLVSVIDSSASSTEVETCIMDVYAETTLTGGFVISSVSVQIATGCGGMSQSVVFVGLEGTYAPPYTIAARQDTDALFTSCGDLRFQPAQMVDGLLNITIGYGEWQVGVCANGGTLEVADPQLMANQTMINSPLPLLELEQGQVCSPGGANTTWIVKSGVDISIQSSLYLPLYVVDAGTDTPVTDYVLYPTSNNSEWLVSVNSLEDNVPALYTLWFEDARLCPNYINVQLVDTGYAPCGTCYVNDTSCYGCDGVPYSNVTYDVCGVCGGNSSCLSTCDIISTTPPAFAPSIINACVAMGETVTGIQPPWIVLSVMVIPYVTVDIRSLLFVNSVTFGRSTQLTLFNNQFGIVSVNSLATSIVSGGINQSLTINGPSTCCSQSGVNVYTVNVQTVALPNNTVIYTTNADTAGHLLVNFVSMSLATAPRVSVDNTGPVTFILIGTAFQNFSIYMSSPTSTLITLATDGRPTSTITFLSIILPYYTPLRYNSTQQIACMYLAKYINVVEYAGNPALNISLTSQSQVCIDFNGGGGASQTPIHGKAPSGTGSGFWWQFSIIMGIIILAVLFMAIVMVQG